MGGKNPFLSNPPTNRESLSDVVTKDHNGTKEGKQERKRTKKAKVSKTFHLEPYLLEYIERLLDGDKKLSSMNQVLNLLLENCYDRKVKI